ncbi:helix-turn-helix transcriptional regulator [Streptomyces cocklensis]|jgi:DNA-binding HxlR family transcriptional regulator|uniref:HxlR family transcriptional regulator n=1 Tax=Actinacidiphila cocklensis TaxID=887465 RepID=A0A9W4GQV5_9ACTN|nr:helix-turn-helix domain-containing protein [Actinacidiphila cocklensis]MDD1062501.1 helix-turn-helix transcriptional regulator [Actinacidiphila cocklensis]WSX72485.1 helix-turn-helix transcriptional regulator [Streptomyces sp. NBC_00899]WSX81446.1 helix-turn-helix transcriptional regulator [Streptomyces sp. NBC_00899]CAG6391961.1 HxlR family transcriptional regulator [Actinacidiphila cocklensis]
MTTRTAAQRHAEARISHQARFSDCPTNRLLDRIGEKWVALIFKELAEGGPRRYGELADAIAGASQKMLTQTLRRLERDGLLSRTVTPAVPVRVDYALTPLGQSLVPVLLAVTRWAEQNIEQIDVAREAHDAQHH